MKKFQYSTQLDELAGRLRGIPPMASINANVYFVMADGHVLLATTLFNTADYVFQQIVMAGQQSAVLADRRFGDVAIYYPAKGMVIDMRMEDYYQQQKLGLTDEQLAKVKAQIEADKAAALRQKQEIEDHVRRVSVPGQWLRYTGTGIDSFFYVQGLGNGCLVGYQCHYNKAQQKIVRVGQVELSTSGHDILSWWPATKAMVRKLKLNSYL